MQAIHAYHLTSLQIYNQISKKAWIRSNVFKVPTNIWLIIDNFNGNLQRTVNLNTVNFLTCVKTLRIISNKNPFELYYNTINSDFRCL